MKLLMSRVGELLPPITRLPKSRSGTESLDGSFALLTTFAVVHSTRCSKTSSRKQIKHRRRRDGPPRRRSGHKMDWRHRAICRDEDPELFFPVGNSGPALLQIAEAKAVCQRCPVTSECLTWALETGQDAGVWGAMSEDERRALKRRRARAR